MNAELPFYLDFEGETKGPFTIQEMRSMWDAGLLNDGTLYCQDGMTKWLPLKDIQIFFQVRAVQIEEKECTKEGFRPLVAVALAVIILAAATVAITGINSGRRGHKSGAVVADQLPPTQTKAVTKHITAKMAPVINGNTRYYLVAPDNTVVAVDMASYARFESVGRQNDVFESRDWIDASSVAGR